MSNSINVKTKFGFQIKDNTSISEINSSKKLGIKNKNLTDIKISNIIQGRSYKIRNILHKNTVIAQREAEYDKNLRRIKSNLIERFNNYSLINSNINDHSQKNINLTRKLKRERSRYNIKQYSPSIANSKKYLHLDKENIQNIDTNRKVVFNHDISLNNCEKNKIISLRIDDKKIQEEENYLHQENNDSNIKTNKKRYGKKILNLNNNIFSIENESENFDINNTSNKNESFSQNISSNLKNRFGKKGLIIDSNHGTIGSLAKENKLPNNSSLNKQINNNKRIFSQSKTTRNINKKFIFKSNFDGKEDTQSNFSNLRKKMKNILHLTNKNSEKRLISNKKVNLEIDKNYYLSNNETNLDLIEKNFEDEDTEKIKNMFDEKDIITDNTIDFLSQIETNYKKFIQENFDSEDMKNLDDKETEMNIDDDNAESLIDKNIQLNLIKRLTDTNNNSCLETIPENNSEISNIKNFNKNNLDISSNQYNSNNNVNVANENTINYYNNGKCCILESGGLSKKFSEMKRTISNNLNNINKLNSNDNESNYEFQNMMIINNQQPEKIFASSLKNSMESIKNLKQNLKILSNNLNSYNTFNDNRDITIYNELENNYLRSLQNSSINNPNGNNNINLSNRLNENLGISNIDINLKTPDMINHNNFLFQNINSNLNNNSYINNNQIIHQNNRSFIASSNIYNSNNFNFKFNELNLNSNKLLLNNQIYSNYDSNKQILSNLQVNSINEKKNNPSNNNYSISGQFKNFTNQLTKINLNEFRNNQQNNQINNIPNNNYPYSDVKTKTINIKNQSLQEQINHINLSFNIVGNTIINNNQDFSMDANNNFPNMNFYNNTIDEINENFALAEKLILFTTDQYRNLLNVFINYDYGKEILKDFHSKNIEMGPILINHQITERMRSKMVDWIIEVTENYKCDQTTYFLSINLMDKYFFNSLETLNPDDLHIIGISCMFIASKYHDIFPIKLASAAEKISHGKLTKEEIKKCEEKILKTLNYDISNPSAYDFLNFFIEEIFNVYENNFNVKNEVLRDYIRQYTESDKNGENKFDKNYYERFTKTKDFDSKFLSTLRKTLLYLCKMNCYDTSLSIIKPSLLAGSTLILGIKITEQVLQKNYINEYVLERTLEVSNVEISEICFIAEKILYNCKNFDKLFPNLSNLKKFYFNFAN